LNDSNYQKNARKYHGHHEQFEHHERYDIKMISNA